MAKRNSKSKCLYNPGKNFFRFPHILEDSPDYFNMSYAARALLHAMCRKYNGFNNGDISIPISEMKLIGWNPGTLNRASKELIINNWIYITKQGGKGKHYQCSLYGISFIPIDEDKKNKFDSEFPTAHQPRSFQKT